MHLGMRADVAACYRNVAGRNVQDAHLLLAASALAQSACSLARLAGYGPLAGADTVRQRCVHLRRQHRPLGRLNR